MKKIIIVFMIVFVNIFIFTDTKENSENINGKIVILVNDNIQKEINEIISDLTLQKILNIKESNEIVDQNRTIEICKTLGINNINIVNKDELINLGKTVNADYIIICKITKDISINKKAQIEIITSFFNVKEEKYIFDNKLDEVINKSDENIIDVLETSKITEVNEIVHFNKGFDFTVGGGFYLINIGGIQYNKLDIHNSSYYIGSDLYLNWGIFLPFSLSYNPSPDASVGFVFETGYAPGVLLESLGSPDYGQQFYMNNIFFNLSSKHKFGYVNNKIRFLLEYGLLVQFMIPSERIETKYIIIGDMFFNLGPEVMAGFEIHKDKFSMDCGYFISGTFGFQSFENYSFDTTRGMNINITNGIKLRFNYHYKNYYAKKMRVKSADPKIIEDDKTIKEDEDIVKLKESKKGDIIEFSNIIFFPDLATIKEESFKVLDEIVKVLVERNDLIIEISGYTNNTGKPEAELLLSINRAKAVADYLIKNKISSKRIKIFGFGSLGFKESEIIEANRKVEIKILDSIK